MKTERLPLLLAPGTGICRRAALLCEIAAMSP